MTQQNGLAAVVRKNYWYYSHSPLLLQVQVGGLYCITVATLLKLALQHEEGGRGRALLVEPLFPKKVSASTFSLSATPLRPGSTLFVLSVLHDDDDD